MSAVATRRMSSAADETPRPERLRPRAAAPLRRGAASVQHSLRREHRGHVDGVVAGTQDQSADKGRAHLVPEGFSPKQLASIEPCDELFSDEFSRLARELFIDRASVKICEP
jgi:hypothetical protein